VAPQTSQYHCLAGKSAELETKQRVTHGSTITRKGPGQSSNIKLCMSGTVKGPKGTVDRCAVCPLCMAFPALLQCKRMSVHHTKTRRDRHSAFFFLSFFTLATELSRGRKWCISSVHYTICRRCRSMFLLREAVSPPSFKRSAEGSVLSGCTRTRKAESFVAFFGPK
jgi:hypothetical protein